MWQYQRTEELYHHGILGMKWGVRRYQNSDGTLTPAGRRKANSLAKKYAKVTGKKLIIKKKEVHDNKPKTANEMTNEELQNAINRINLVNTYNRLITPQTTKRVSLGKRFVTHVGKNVVGPSLTDTARTNLTKYLNKIGNDIIYPKKEKTEFEKIKERAELSKNRKQAIINEEWYKQYLQNQQKDKRKQK